MKDYFRILNLIPQATFKNLLKTDNINCVNTLIIYNHAIQTITLQTVKTMYMHTRKQAHLESIKKEYFKTEDLISINIISFSVPN